MGMIAKRTVLSLGARGVAATSRLLMGAASVACLLLWPDSQALGNCNLSAGETIDLVLTDITGFKGIGATPSSSVPRIPLFEQPDGIACDGLDGVSDGAMLLVRVLVPNSLSPAMLASLSADFGYVSSGSFALLPTSPAQEGEYISLGIADESALSGLGVANPGAAYEVSGSGKKVLAAMIYRPPLEFDRGNPMNTSKQRGLELAAQVKSSEILLCKVSKDIIVVRPPILHVHGIDDSYDAALSGSAPAPYGHFLGLKPASTKNWTLTSVGKSWVEEFTDWGWVCEGVNQSLPLDGNGDVHDAYKDVMTKICNGSAASVTKNVRDGVSFPGKKVAIQKCDVVAHSYGGILIRWYVEMSPEYRDRRDVRKVITLNTPHRGTPLANLTCAAYKNPLLYNAETKAASPGVTLGERLEELNDWYTAAPFVPPVLLRVHTTLLDGPGADADIMPAVQVLTVGSAALAELNNTPFAEDVAYAAIVGKNTSLMGWANMLSDYEPYWDPGVDADFKSYFPWYSGLDGGALKSDGMVPIWSQRLPKRDMVFDADHLSVFGHYLAREQVRAWLQDVTLPRGIAHRDPFLTLSITDAASRANAYLGSVYDSGPDPACILGDIVAQAIVRTTFSPLHPSADLNTGTDPMQVGSRGGIIKVTCTGMVSDGSRTIDVVADRSSGLDKDLHKTIAVPYAGPGAAGCLKTFSVEGKIARQQDGSIIGPDDSLQSIYSVAFQPANTWHVGYEMSGATYFDWSAMQSPGTAILFPPYALPAPSGPSTVPGSFTVVGGGEHPSGPAQVNVQLRASIPWLSDVTLYDGTFALDSSAVPVSFEGALIPYEMPLPLIAEGGFVAGSAGNSGQTTANVYQRKVTGTSKDSPTISVSAP